ncbi:MAG: VOC family protein [Chlorobia bacterium]|nr:VOC family protein [Fimbriimonadaceae bacterium]
MLGVHDCNAAIEFYKRAFSAEEVGERHAWEGKIGHAELNIQGALIMLADEFPTHNSSPKTLGGTPVILHLEVDDADRWLKSAVDAGAEVLAEAKDQPYGRTCKIKDPFGHVWMFNGPLTQ